MQLLTFNLLSDPVPVLLSPEPVGGEGKALDGSTKVTEENKSVLLFSDQEEVNSPDMNLADIDLTQESDSEETNLVNMSDQDENLIPCSQKRQSQHSSFDPSSIDAILARARSLMEDLNGDKNHTPAKIPSNSIENSPENLEIVDVNLTVTKTKSPTATLIVEEEICLIDESDDSVEEQINAPAVLHPSSANVSVLKGLSKIDWSNDRFSLELNPNHPIHSSQSQREGGVDEYPEFGKSLNAEKSAEINFEPTNYQPSPPPVNYDHLQCDDQPMSPVKNSQILSHLVVDLCEDEESEPELALELQQIQFCSQMSNQKPTAVIDEKRAKSQSPQKSIKSPSSSTPAHTNHPPQDIPLNQLIIRTESVTPPPDFKSMPAEKLTSELERYGIKSVISGPKAVKLLEHIYTQLHPLVAEDVDLEDLHANPLNETVLNLTQQLNVQSHENTIPLPITQGEAGAPLIVVNPKSSSRSKTKATCELPLEIAFKNRLQFDPDYHLKILHYIPIELKELMFYFKSIGCKYDSKDVVALLDQYCVTYRTVEQQKISGKKNTVVDDK